MYLDEKNIIDSHEVGVQIRSFKGWYKKHHEFTAPIGLAAAYCHPLEHLLSNLFPIYIGPILCGSHLCTVLIWHVLVSLSVINTHSGYHFPFFPSPQAHDYHHLKFNECFGVLGICDWIHGTDKKFRASPQFQQHYTYMDFESFVAKGREARAAEEEARMKKTKSLGRRFGRRTNHILISSWKS